MKIRNLDRLKRKIAMLPKATLAELQAALVQSGEEIADIARAFAPVKSGALKRSIGVTIGEYIPDNSNVRGVSAGGGGHDLSVTVHAGDHNAYYAAFVEFGTAAHRNGGLFKGTIHPGSSAHPFFYPAYRLGKKRAKARISRAIIKAAKKVAAGK